MSKEVDFTEFTKKNYADFKYHEQNVKSLCVAQSAMPLSYFNDVLHNELQPLNDEDTSPKQRDTVADYMELFKAFDEYPANLQRPKKRERANSTLQKGGFNMLTDNVCAAGITAATTPVQLPRQEDPRSGKTIYQDFKKFQKKLRQALEEKLPTEQYISKIRQLQHFAHQLEKLMPAAGEYKQVFSAEEEMKLNAIAANMAQLNFMHANGYLFQGYNTGGACIAELEMLVDVLNYTLIQISGFNNV